MLLSSSLADFYAYLMAYRTGNPDGIPESWCVWDTGEDNCSRFLRYGAKDGYWAGEKPPVGVGRLPYRSMEYTAYACELAQVIGEIHARLGEADAAHRGTHHPSGTEKWHHACIFGRKSNLYRGLRAVRGDFHAGRGTVGEADSIRKHGMPLRGGSRYRFPPFLHPPFST